MAPKRDPKKAGKKLAQITKRPLKSRRKLVHLAIYSHYKDCAGILKTRVFGMIPVPSHLSIFVDKNQVTSSKYCESAHMVMYLNNFNDLSRIFFYKHLYI